MDILVVIKEKGITGLRELTEHLVDNLNFRSFERTSYDTRLHPPVSSAVVDTEIEKYLELYFGLSKEQSRLAINDLIELGFLIVAEKTYGDHPHRNARSRLISSNLRG